MAHGILVIGESGTGKSTSLENLNPETTFIINIKNKPLPFKGWKNKYTPLTKDTPNGNYVAADNADRILQIMKHVSDTMAHIKTIVLEDFQYMAANEFMNRISEKGLTF